ncbi:hypothetical protein MHU86_22219 [Fragilaria crotonensis]|nr:hypothetical protein MHU86_22219 [Fragilaria crotonensis]
MSLISSGRRRRREQRAVCEAESTFIGSGLEEFENVGVDIPIEGVGPVRVVYVTGKLPKPITTRSTNGRYLPSLQGWYWATLQQTSLARALQGWVQSIVARRRGTSAFEICGLTLRKATRCRMMKPIIRGPRHVCRNSRKMSRRRILFVGVVPTASQDFL